MSLYKLAEFVITNTENTRIYGARREEYANMTKEKLEFRNTRDAQDLVHVFHSVSEVYIVIGQVQEYTGVLSLVIILFNDHG